MTQEEWVKLTIQNVNYSPRIAEDTARTFNKLIKSNPKFSEQARAFFGERNIYHAENYAVDTFIRATLNNIRISSALSRGSWIASEKSRKR